MLPIALVALCVIARVVPHPPNFAPVGAMAVFAGRTLRPWSMLLTVVVASLVGDAALAAVHGYPMLTWVTPFVYGAFALQGLLGFLLRSVKGGALLAAGSGALVFFAVSNLGVWLASGMYPVTAAGLAQCYALALPFLGATLLGDLVWTAILSVAYRQLATRLEGSPRLVPAGTARLPAL